ncbi:50S ribosomal protein L4 [candidate division WWE3 bacterium CG_4_9_14_0_2_um_filter_35_11]|uniref:Large ribosomal subunit protein uL4 n=1 Tax=candidate division WWE3 bacterium CG_4_9_14_0_2_um_filter_35_11 TaxID=1975077 RepID=A0A2M8EL44_UNCKA|nr:MAG: 50S ribosomal protein L4 [candidate division WWE3 bacterium CG10_big_fil_rev_8_21_14_0_10_35_32]PJC23420.1 MAG: 50S ribosomal protein L4 [candidate division WWE3 bacterium CG_4_9_14_0_2_um_filter_35_11]
MKIKLFDYNGKETGDVNITSIDGVEKVNVDLISQYIRSFLLSQRHGTVKVKGKGEVRGGGKKPWRQKGTGRARSGSNRSPLWVGGGVSHGPSPRNWASDLSKKMKKVAFIHCVFAKVQEGSVRAFSYNDEEFSTKNAMVFLKNLGNDSQILIVHNSDDKLFRSFRNLALVDIKSVENLNVFDVFKAKNVMFEEKSIEALNRRLS